jgi:prolyl 4-hydroxylase
MDIGYDYEKCIGLKVKPRKGDGLLFYSLMTNGTIDPVSSGHKNCS